MASGIYAIEHRASGRAYVGSAADLGKRWKAHVWHLNHGRHHCQHLQRAWRKEGAAAFTFLVLQECSREMLLFREQVWMDGHRLLYNASRVAGRIVLDREAVLRRNAAIKRAYEIKPIVRTAEWRAKLSAAHKGTKKPRTPEHQAKLAASLRGRKRPAGIAEKRRATMLTRPYRWSEERRLAEKRRREMMS